MTAAGIYHSEEEYCMLVIDGNSVYEIDEECIRKKKVPKECRTYEKIMREHSKKEKRERGAAEI